MSTPGNTEFGRASGGVGCWLVAIAVFAVLMWGVGSMISPREHCRKDQCANNIRECALALQLYYNDYDSRLPSSFLVSHSKRWNSRDFETFCTKTGRIPPGPHDRLVTWPQVLYEHMKSKDIMFCNNDPVDHTNPNAQVSYWWKLAVDKAWYGVGCKELCQKESDFLWNSDDIIFYEHCAWHCGEADGLRDGSQIHVAYLDSHVRTVSLANTTTGNRENCFANRGGEPMYFNFDNDKPAGTNNPEPGPAKLLDPSHCSDRF